MAARRRLPASLFDYLEGGAEDERSVINNSNSFSKVRFSPSVLTDVSRISTEVLLLGRRMALPFFLAPTGMSRLFHPGREIATAQAASQAGIFYGLSTLSTTSLETVAAASPGPKMFQVYIFKDRGLTREFVERARVAKYDALCLTVDTPMAGNRERDRRNGMQIPPRLSLSTILGFAARPRWTWDFLLDRNMRLANLAHRPELTTSGSAKLLEYVNSQFDRSVTWDDAARLARDWGCPFVIKGVLTKADALRARDIGATAIMISNHGGRQLDDVPSPLDLIGPIREAVDPAFDLIIDGGVRRGADIVKALALGASACAIGRPYLYGLAAAGEKGVTGVIETLRDELVRTMTLLGRSDVTKLDRTALT